MKLVKSADPEGGDRGSGPLGKLQVIWVSIGNKQLDTPEEVGPPWKMLEPIWNLEKMIVFFKINYLTSVK